MRVLLRSTSLAVLLLLHAALGGCASEGYRDVSLPPPPAIDPLRSAQGSQTPRKLFVDLELKTARCEDYDPDKRRCGEGSFIAFSNLNRAAAAVVPGDRVLVRGGIIREQFLPVASGSEEQPVVFSPYKDESVVFRDIDKPAWLLKDKRYLTLEGFRMERVLGWARLENAHYNRVRNNDFFEAQARGTTGGFKVVNSHYNQVQNNRFKRGNDSLVLQASDRNLIENNQFEWARHSLLSVRCGNYNVIRNNRFHNERQKAMEVYDCEAISDAPYRLDATKRNLIEGNAFVHARASSRPHKYNAIQYAGQLGIVRNNLFHDSRGGAVNLQVYADEALYNYGHRIYANTFVANRCFALIDHSRGGARVGGHVYRNNLFYRNLDCSGLTRQVDLPWQDLDRKQNLLAETAPGFKHEPGGDFTPRAGSPLIDSGVFLTHTEQAGEGRALVVKDAAFFFEGAGVPGVAGDQIRLEGSDAGARILQVDIQAGQLLLDRPLKWQAGQGVALVYHGAAPEMGAYEFSPPQAK